MQQKAAAGGAPAIMIIGWLQRRAQAYNVQAYASDVLSDVLQSGGLIQRQLEMPVTETSDTRELHLQHRLQQRDERRRGPTRESRPSARGR
eukprot:COSAG01_NODE_15343_length_1347_cov_34.905449_1_plen_90_part_10